MPLAEAPSVKDEIVLGDLRQCGIQGLSGGGRQNYIVECPARHNRLNRAAPACAEETKKWERRHVVHPIAYSGRKQQDHLC
jgi:hypothetical protein